MSKAPLQRFRATITKAGGKTYVALPFDPNERWGDKDRHYVRGSVGDNKIRGVLLFDGTEFVLPLGPAWMRDNPVSIGATVAVALEPDGPVGGALPDDLAAALEAEPEAKRFFESVAPFYRKNVVRWIETAKRVETRASRVTEAVRLLKAGKTM